MLTISRPVIKIIIKHPLMDSTLLSAIVLGAIGAVAAAVLYAAARRFRVEEDPRIEQIESLLPGANCGGCGKSGCHDFACACAAATTMEGLNCPGAAPDVMARIAEVAGLGAVQAERHVAVLKCAGVAGCRPRAAHYEGPAECAALAVLGSGEGLCAYGCLGLGDCVASCKFGALSMDAETGLPVIDGEACTGCGACAARCPRGVIVMRPRGPRGMRVWVACSNPRKGAVAVRECKAACIGCGKCVRACPHGAIELDGGMARIDPHKCRLCRKCVDTCPTDAIHKANFPEKTVNDPIVKL